MNAQDSLKLARRFIELPAAKRRLFLDAMRGEGVDFALLPIAPGVEVAARDALSYAQQRMWFAWRLDAKSAAYNLPMAVKLKGPIAPEALQQALDTLVARHESLRTVFPEVDDQPRQCVQAQASIRGELLDLSHLQGEAQAQQVEAVCAAESAAPFDLAAGPLMRVRLLRTSATEHLLLITLHHIIADGWSLGILIDELVRLYDAAVAGQASALAPLAIQYRDFALWQRSWLEAGEQARQLEYWLDHLGNDHPVLQLPSDHLRPALPNHRGERLELQIDAALAQRLQALARRHNVTLFVVLLAAFKALLYRYSGQSRVRVGVPIANRNRSEVEGLIGCFINTQVLQTDIDPTQGGAHLLSQVKACATQAQSHQDVPFDKLVEALGLERTGGVSPLFQVLFNHQSMVTDVATVRTASGLELEKLELRKSTARFDLTLDTVEVAGQLRAAFTFALDLFERDTVEAMGRDWLSLLAALSRDDVAALGDWPLAGAPVAAPQVLPYAGPLLHQRVAAFAKAQPQRIAVVSADGSLSYGELDARADQLCAQLQAHGVVADQPVGLIAERSVNLLVGLLAIFKAGGAYVPLEPGQPQQRMAFMLRDAQIKVLLRAEDEPGPAIGGVQCLALNAAGGEAGVPVAVHSGNLAYVIYTSGTTGMPKGVAVSHGALANYLEGLSERIALSDLEHFAMVSTPAADLGHTMLFGALWAGKTVHLLQREAVLDADGFAAYLSANHVDALKIVPSHLGALLDACADANVLPQRCLVLGGEACPPALLARIGALRPGLKVLNHYGPTETTVGVLTAELAAGEVTHLGSPLRNSRVQVLDATLQVVPGMAKGELCIAGAGLARGYLARPGLTAERFVPDAHGEPGARLYRTGDVVQRDRQGRLLYLGRVDHQLKIRGYRVEPGEIEACLQGLPDVDKAVVRATGQDGSLQLLAYLVAPRLLARERDAEAAQETVQKALKLHMQAHMVPARVLFLDSLPLTANGKVDLARLPLPDQQHPAASHTPAQTPLQIDLANLWQEVLGCPQVGLDDNFFALGGHSLMATQIVSRARRQLGLDIPLRLLFDTADLRSFSRGVSQLGEVADAPIQVLDRQAWLPVSHAQYRQWLFWKIHPHSSAYHTPMAVRITGALDREALAQAFSALVSRHESLRTCFEEQQGVPGLRVHANLAVTLEQQQAQAFDPAQLLQQLQADIQQPFDLANGPLIRMKLYQRGEQEHLLLVTLHHIVSDGWSMGVMVRECIAVYNHHATGAAQPDFAPLPVQYADYASWQRERLSEGQMQAQLGYWQAQLEDDFAVLQLPADRPRPELQSYRGGRLDVRLPAQLTADLRRLAVRCNATLFHVFLASFGLLLARYSGKEKINIGVPMTNRNRLELEGLIGFFVNTVVLRLGVDYSVSFEQLLAHTKEISLQAQANKDLPFDALVEALQPERGMGYNPLFQVMYNHLRDLGEQVTGQSLNGLQVEEVDLDEGTAQFDLSLDTVERSDGVLATFTYAVDLFDPSRIGRMATHWLNLLQALCAQPHACVDCLALATADERRLVERDWCQGPAEQLSDTAVARQFEAQVLRAPDAVAVIHEGQAWSYAELNRRANRLAHRLQALGAGPEVLIGVALERGLGMVAGLLAILKVGAAYVPLDPDYPAERLAYMIEDSGLALLLTQASLSEQLAVPACVTQVCLDALLEDGDASNPQVAIDPATLAYVMYTSGSTGRPKGVAITQGALSQHAQVSLGFFNLKPSDRILQFATFNFDGFVEQLYPALICGASVVVRGPELWGSERFYRELISNDISVVDVTTAYWFMLAKDFAEHGPRDYGRLHQFHAGGEAMPPEGLLAWQAAGLSHVTLLNTYGPTEATVTVTAHDCAPYLGATAQALPPVMPIGRVLAGRSIHVLDNSGGAVLNGAIGELMIGGELLARGYHQRPGLTAERFIPDPFGAPGSRLYRSGDLARYLADGQIEYAGRIDHQVKIRGFRIELGEVGARLLEHASVRDALVIDVDGPLGKQLVGYLVPAVADVAQASVQTQQDLLAQLRADLRSRLPDYMVPAHLMWLPELPLSPNGKLDRKALPQPDLAQLQVRYVPPYSDTECKVAAIWADVLRIKQVGLDDNFFELGGHSLLAAQALSRINSQLGIDMPIRLIFETPVLRAFAQALEGAGQALTEEGLADIEQLMNELTEA
ncbi:non-ribosomal peptide synthetase [Pseudomonas putida]|uniref:non-ribosomal peptide synthetase n=1 Tax=Pseudomonas putida TaxID=303 RepID=UPI00106F5F10|nr:non-ribosomal peptide synthetase [Pseudomonas putida]TFF49900.1 non-ribosomal peptide synthetase [Pseudomonas putida]